MQLHCVLLKKKISVSWIKSNWFDFIHYTEIIFLRKNVIFLYIFKIFFYILKIFFTMLHLKIFLKYWIILYIFRNIVVFNKPLRTPFYRTPLDDCFWLNKSDLHSFVDDNTIAITCSNLNDLLRVFNIQIDLLCICLLRAFAHWRTN